MSRSATDQAYEWIRTRIFMGELPVGSFVEEATVCSAAGVSRTPVREAMHRLAGERIIELVPRRGAQVRQVSSHEASEAAEARGLIESTSIKQVLAQGTDISAPLATHLGEMNALVGEPGWATSREVRIAYNLADRAFHRTWVEACGNSLIVEFYDGLWQLNTWTSVQGNLLRFADTIHRQHVAMYEAMVAKNEDGALSTLRTHLRPLGASL